MRRLSGYSRGVAWGRGERLEYSPPPYPPPPSPSPDLGGLLCADGLPKNGTHLLGGRGQVFGGGRSGTLSRLGCRLHSVPTAPTPITWGHTHRWPPVGTAARLRSLVTIGVGRQGGKAPPPCRPLRQAVPGCGGGGLAHHLCVPPTQGKGAAPTITPHLPPNGGRGLPLSPHFFAPKGAGPTKPSPSWASGAREPHPWWSPLWGTKWLVSKPPPLTTGGWVEVWGGPLPDQGGTNGWAYPILENLAPPTPEGTRWVPVRPEPSLSGGQGRRRGNLTRPMAPSTGWEGKCSAAGYTPLLWVVSCRTGARFWPPPLRGRRLHGASLGARRCAFGRIHFQCWRRPIPRRREREGPSINNVDSQPAHQYKNR